MPIVRTTLATLHCIMLHVMDMLISAAFSLKMELISMLKHMGMPLPFTRQLQQVS